MIGVIALPKIHSLHESNIQYAKKYVKWIESSGAKALIIPYDISLPDLLTVLKSIQGIVFIGGAIENKKLYSHQQYITYVTTLYHAFTTIKTYNDQGHYFPIWGTCLGFEILILFSMHSPSTHLFEYIQKHPLNTNRSLTLKKSRMK